MLKVEGVTAWLPVACNNKKLAHSNKHELLAAAT
jgi:hypothetical protein